MRDTRLSNESSASTYSGGHICAGRPHVRARSEGDGNHLLLINYPTGSEGGGAVDAIVRAERPTAALPNTPGRSAARGCPLATSPYGCVTPVIEKKANEKLNGS